MLFVKGRGVHQYKEAEPSVYIGTFFGAFGATWAHKFVELFNAEQDDMMGLEEKTDTVKVPKETWNRIVQAVKIALESPVDGEMYQVDATAANLLWNVLKLAKEVDV